VDDETLPRRARLRGAWGRGAQTSAGDGPRRVPPRLLASWQRSEAYGVPLESIEPSFSDSYDDESLFAACGREVLDGLHGTLAGEPVSLMLTDPEGFVLSRLCSDGALLRDLDAVHLAPGFGYAERTVGTNGLGLALADRAPTLVRADEHYTLSLCTYTCAAAPVMHPATGRVEGCVNLTTWSRSSSGLLLALAQSAAATTSALLLARSGAPRDLPASRGQVVRLGSRLEPGAGTVSDLSAAWRLAGTQAGAALAAGHAVLAAGEPGAGRATLLAQALRRRYPRHRILAVSPPAVAAMQQWLDLWTPEIGKPDTAVILRDVDRLPHWVAGRVRDVMTQPSHPDGLSARFAATAEEYDAVAEPLASALGAVVGVPPLRERPDDIAPLARHAALRARGRELDLTPACESVLRAYGWPGNVRELQQVVRAAAGRTDVIDVRHLPPGLLSGTTRRLTRIEAFERDEIARVLSRPGVSVREAADELGVSRATIYRKLVQYDIRVPGRSAAGRSRPFREGR
jgi:transcriptional regulator of acetoin/glycerol metabolism